MESDSGVGADPPEEATLEVVGTGPSYEPRDEDGSPSSLLESSVAWGRNLAATCYSLFLDITSDDALVSLWSSLVTLLSSRILFVGLWIAMLFLLGFTFLRTRERANLSSTSRSFYGTGVRSWGDEMGDDVGAMSTYLTSSSSSSSSSSSALGEEVAAGDSSTGSISPLSLKISTHTIHVSHSCDMTSTPASYLIKGLDGVAEGAAGLGATYRLEEGTGRLVPAGKPGHTSKKQPDLTSSSSPTSDAPLPLFVLYGDPSEWAGYVSPNLRQTLRLLLNVYGWRTFTPRRIGRASVSYSSWEALNVDLEVAFTRRPDVLLFLSEVGMTLLPGLGRRYIRKGILNSKIWVMTDEIHWRTKDERHALLSLFSRADRILSPYAYLLPDLFPEIEGKVPVAWVPHAAGVGHQIPLNTRDPSPHVLVTGSLSSSHKKWYRYGDALLERLGKEGSTFIHVSKVRANASTIDADGRGGGIPVAGWQHASVLSRHLVCLVDGLLVNYALPKVFEIPAAGCLLLVNEELVPILSRLGLSPFRHFMSFTPATLDSVVAALLDPLNRYAVDEMRGAAQRLVWARHTTTHRATLLHETAIAEAPLVPPSTS